MATKTIIAQEDFNSLYRADCIDCGEYVGDKRVTRQEADADAEKHKARPGKSDHDVQIEVTQRSPI